MLQLSLRWIHVHLKLNNISGILHSAHYKRRKF